MNEILSLIIVLSAGYLLSGIFYGLILLTGFLNSLHGWSWISRYSTLLISCFLTFCISKIIGNQEYQFRNLHHPSIYIIALITVAVTVCIILRKNDDTDRTPCEIVSYGLDGFAMEIAQRWMMQPLITWMLIRFHVSSIDFFTILLTAVIWCLGILTQAFLQRAPVDRKLILDVISSLIFSIGIGTVFQMSHFILLTMSAHVMERVISAVMQNKRLHRK